MKNDDLDHEWTTGGKLHVKGVLIGSGLEEVAEAGRSDLNYRFYANDGDEEAVKEKHKQDIMSGASLMIEFNPALYDDAKVTPPGAKDFINQLEVYRS
ncbi:MAG: hypothetical protein K6E76_02530 [Patescibacteria group bacterium]|nr:hypothetical protein [Patescibacteria group bacterium]